MGCDIKEGGCVVKGVASADGAVLQRSFFSPTSITFWTCFGFLCRRVVTFGLDMFVVRTQTAFVLTHLVASSLHQQEVVVVVGRWCSPDGPLTRVPVVMYLQTFVHHCSVCSFQTCSFLRGTSAQWIHSQKVPFAVKGNQWVGFDDHRSYDEKV